MLMVMFSHRRICVRIECLVMNKLQGEWIGLVAVIGDVDQRRKVVFNKLLCHETRSVSVVVYVFSVAEWCAA